MIPLGVIGSFGTAGGGGGSYHANAITLDPTTFGSLIFDNSGAAILASPTGSFGIKFRVNGGGAGVGNVIMYHNGLAVFLHPSTGRLIAYVGSVGSPGSSCGIYDFGVVPVGIDYHSFLISWDRSTQSFHSLFDGAGDVHAVNSAGSSTTCTWDVGNLYFGCYLGNQYAANMDIAELYFDPSGAFLDVTSSTIKNRWDDSVTGKPVSIGTDGHILSGTIPKIYCNNAAASAGTNKGSLSNLTIQGTITDAPSSPSD